MKNALRRSSALSVRAFAARARGFVAAALLLTSCATAPGAPLPLLPQSDRLSLGTRWMSAVVTRDRRALDRLLADDFASVSVDGVRRGKAEELDARMAA